jgi:hypothetical protein
LIVRCEQCGERYDDEFRWTVCPHNSIEVAHDTPYCRRHDLYNCGLCNPDPIPAPIIYDHEGTEDTPIGELVAVVRDLLADPRCAGFDGLEYDSIQKERE